MANSITELVEKFARNSVEYTNPKYNETRLRIEFVNPFWELPGGQDAAGARDHSASDRRHG